MQTSRSKSPRPPVSTLPLLSKRGSVLLVALLVCALIALGIGSLLSLNLASSRQAKRTLHGYAGLNLVEAGVEEGTWSFNRAAAGDGAAWTGWTQSTGAAWRKFSNFDYGNGTTGAVKVYVNRFDPPDGFQPKIVALASIERAGVTPVTKMLEVTLRQRSFFATGIAAKETVVFNGSNTSVDSWNSDPDRDPSTPPIDYSAGLRADRGSVATGSPAVKALQINNAHIWGYASTGGAAPHVTNGSIRGVSTPADVQIDQNRITTDFNADFPDVAMPSDGIAIATIGPTLGTYGLATKWRCASLTLSGTETLTILGNVTLIITAPPGTNGVQITGKAAIIIPDGSSLKLYTESDVLIAGQGVGNENIFAGAFTIWGTNRAPSSQSIDIVGKGALRGAIYGPNAEVKINGNGDVMGSIIARKITLGGNAAFHFDEALAESAATGPFSIGKWRELTTESERQPYLNVFNGW
jgi:hypothetical protein